MLGIPIRKEEYGGRVWIIWPTPCASRISRYAVLPGLLFQPTPPCVPGYIFAFGTEEQKRNIWCRWRKVNTLDLWFSLGAGSEENRRGGVKDDRC